HGGGNRGRVGAAGMADVAARQRRVFPCLLSAGDYRCGPAEVRVAARTVFSPGGSLRPPHRPRLRPPVSVSTLYLGREALRTGAHGPRRPVAEVQAALRVRGGRGGPRGQSRPTAAAGGGTRRRGGATGRGGRSVRVVGRPAPCLPAGAVRLAPATGLRPVAFGQAPRVRHAPLGVPSDGRAD